MYRRTGGELDVLLVHPGGPFWKNRDDGAWTIPKGELDGDEEPLACARREFREEVGIDPGAKLVHLGEIIQKGGKRVIAFAVEGDFDLANFRSNTFDMEWPPRSGRMQSFPEVDEAQWMTLALARTKMLPAQCEFLDLLVALVG